MRRRAKTSARLVERASIVLMSADGVSDLEQGRRLGVNFQRVHRWRLRWVAASTALAEAEAAGASKRDLAALVRRALDDAPRSGTPAKFSAEQLAMMLAVACEEPEASGRPVTHWTPRELADEVIKRGIVDAISVRHIDRLLKRGPSGRTRADIG